MNTWNYTKSLNRSIETIRKRRLVRREIFKEVPPKVEYSLTDLGRSFVPVLNTMCEWGYKYAIIKGIDKDSQIYCDHN
nr:winged helix-turn-helix transcriptional regulator [Metabacillus dongyingensis]